MAEEGAAATNSTSTSLNEVGKLFSGFFELLFGLIGLAAMNTSKEKSLLVIALVVALVLYYMALVIGTMLQFHIKNLFPFKMLIHLLASVVVFLALMMISPMIAWIYFGLLIIIIIIFAIILCYKNREEFYRMIPQRIKNFIEGQDEISGNGNGTSTENSDIPGVELVSV